MQQADKEDPSKLVGLLAVLTAEEGDSVEICHPNPDFDGPDASIVVRRDFGEDLQQYFGPSVLDCLEQALAEREKADGSNDQGDRTAG